MKRFLVFLIIVVLLGGGAFFLTRKPQVKSFLLSLKERPTEPEETPPPVVTKPKVEKKIPVTKVGPVMRKIDTDGDGIPDTFVMKGEPGSVPATSGEIPKGLIVTKAESVMRKIDTDGDGIPDTFVMKGEPGSVPATSGEIPKGLITVYCYYVADGDTIYVKLRDGRKEKIRLVGIDTPEIKHGSRGRDEPGGQEAKKFVVDRCSGKTVFLDTDDESPVDYYGRTLALVYTANTSYKIPRNSLNAVLLQKGYAKVLYIPPSEFNPYTW